MEQAITTVRKENPSYIKIGAIMRLGLTNATIICDAYASDNADKKMASIEAIKNMEASIETKLKFIGDVITRPKKERIAISNSLSKLIEKEGEKKGE